MYLPFARSTRQKNRKKTNRKKAQDKAKQRRRINGMHGLKLGRKLGKKGR